MLAQETEHFSGSDLYELCAEAASIPLYEDTPAQPQCAPSRCALCQRG